MLDFNHILASTPGLDLQYFVGGSSTTLIQWQTWRKPRGAKWVYLFGVGGGASGGTGINTGTASGGGQGGGSGAQSQVMIPAFMIPDILYIQAATPALGPSTSGSSGVAGLPTYVCIEPSTTLTPNMTLLAANGSPAGGTAANSASGGLAGAVATVVGINGMPLAGRGFYSLGTGVIGGVGGNGSIGSAGANVSIPTIGNMVVGGTGGGGCQSTTAFAGGGYTLSTTPLGADFFFANTLAQIAGSAGAVTSTPAANGTGGFSIRNYIMNTGGTGGGGATTTAGGVAGAGGNGAPGCGGGGSGGANTTNATLKAGDGGPGFVLIASW